MVTRRRVLATAAIVLGCGACTQNNPAFGHHDAETKAGDTSDDDGIDDGIDDGDVETTGDTASTGTTTRPVDTGDTTFDDSTGTSGPTLCTLPEPTPFSVILTDVQNAPIPPACGEAITMVGSLMNVGNAALTLAVCTEGSCPCVDNDVPFVTFSFIDLSPSPAAVLQSADDMCLSISVRWTSEPAGCTVDTLSVERSNTADPLPPAYIAANSAKPAHDAFPAITLGDPRSTCEPHECAQERPPGRYWLRGGESVTAPGQPSVKIPIDVAATEVSYSLTALIAQVDESCTDHVSWVAARVD